MILDVLVVERRPLGFLVHFRDVAELEFGIDLGGDAVQFAGLVQGTDVALQTIDHFLLFLVDS